MRNLITGVYLKKAIKKRKPCSFIIGKSIAKKVLLLITIESEQEYSIIKKIVEIFHKNKLEVDVICVFKDEKHISSLGTISNDFLFVSPKSFTFFMDIKDDKLKSVLSNSYDALVSFAVNKNDYISYISILSNSDIKISYPIEDTLGVFDMMIDSKTDSSVIKFAEYCLLYLTNKYE